MKAHLQTLLPAGIPVIEGKNIVREYLQARILLSLQQMGAMVPLAFHGGTALRFLFGSERYSEDLDFALEQSQEQYSFRRFVAGIRRDLAAEGYATEVKINDQRTVHVAIIRFVGLLHQLGLTPRATQLVAIKIDVDTQPPAGAALATTLVRRHATLRLQHHDRASLLAGKLHALLQRKYLKGRDVYDLLWYLSDRSWPAPNMTLLNNALAQSGDVGPRLTGKNWKQRIGQRLAEADWAQVIVDVVPFVADPRAQVLLARENIVDLLGEGDGVAT